MVDVRSRVAASIILASFFAGAPAAHAAINQIALFRVANFVQSSSAAPTVASGYDYSARTFVDSAGDFNGATLTYPGPASPRTYTSMPDSSEPAGFFFGFNSPLAASQAVLDSRFPFGTYTTTATNSSTSASQSSSISYSVDAYPLSIPALTPASYTAMQAVDPSQAITVNFGAFSTNANSNESDVFFNLFDADNNNVFSESFLPASTTSITIPAGTLTPGAGYTYNLIFSERITSTNAGDNVFDVLGYDYSTNGAVTTVPEPASLALVGAAGAAGLLRRRRGR